MDKHILSVENLSVTYGTKKNAFKAVNNVSFNVSYKETFGIVGESGSGKTTIGRAILDMAPISGGKIVYKGKQISGKLSKKDKKWISQEIQMIFQDPMASLNERAKVDYIVSEGLFNMDTKISEAKRQELIHNAMEDVGLLPEFLSRFPHEFSGGQRQRIGIARVLVMEPNLIIADEPISALDVSIRAQILNLLSSLQEEKGLTYIFISHDLSVMRFITDRIAVIHKGVIVEMAKTEQLFAHPLHPYTKSLLSAIPQPDPIIEKNKKLIVYDPSVHDYSLDKPAWVEIEEGHFVLANKKEQQAYQDALSTSML